MTEREKMQQGIWYDANFDAELLREREKAAALYFAFNHTHPKDTARQREILSALIPGLPESVSIQPDFTCDYGWNIQIGAHSSVNHHCYFMDGGKITLGSHVFMGPYCGLYTANHPKDAASRNRGLEKAAPITIGDNVWLGGNVVILPGVTIGSGSIIGAGSVVTKDIPENVIAAGNPCQVLRPITEADRLTEAEIS